MPKINAPTIDEHKTLTRNALLEAGVEAFVAYGLAGTSIGILADTAGIARTTVYEYFPNKESVLAALINDRLPPIVDQVLADLPAGSARDRIAKILERSLRFVLEYPDEATLLFRVSRELPKPERDAAWSVFDRVRQEVERLCREGVASGEFPDVDPVSLGRIIADHVVGGIDELSVRGPERAETVLRSRVAFLKTGLSATD
ncbi:MAG: TetR/AcrR family transcriptional regulator [Acidimicrobiia bacterium]|nr:TetR/AcrR family transcriptional regulator [Acidimicrobiia bacterium]